jgi:hypothetical protein
MTLAKGWLTPFLYYQLAACTAVIMIAMPGGNSMSIMEVKKEANLQNKK